jgi:serine/threonine-protein kinase
MAVVYLAERADGLFEQKVALKLIKLGIEAEEMTRRFEQERQILASLDHPAIARLFDGGVADDGRPFIAMEPVDGLPIDAYCDKHRLTLDDRLQLFLTVAEAVQYAHRNLVVHRDLKASNTLVTKDGRVKLLDFGIAKLISEDTLPHAAPPTRTGVRIMTPEYASPEQVRGKPVSTSSDVYQLGLLLYELLTGLRPYQMQGSSPVEIERLICEQDPIPPSSAVTKGAIDPSSGIDLKKIGRARRVSPDKLHRRLRYDLDTIVLMALRKEPERRYATVKQLCQDIERYLAGQPILARKDTVGYRARKFIKRHTFGVMAAAVLATLVVGMTGFHTTRLASERDRAQLEAEKANQVSSFLKHLFEFSDPGFAQGEELSARELLDRGTTRISASLQEQPEVRAELMVVLGSIYFKLGLFEQAEELYAQALEIRREHWGERHAQVVPSINALAQIYAEQGGYQEAEELYQQALDILQGKVKPDQLNLAAAYGGLANVYGWQGDMAEAERLQRQALKIREKQLGDDDLLVAATLNDLGGIIFLSGRYDEAQGYFQRSLAIREQALTLEHPEVAESRNNLAVVYERNEQFDEAEKLYRSTITIWERTLSSTHPRLGRVLNNLATLHARQGELSEAEPLFLRSLRLREASLGADHPEVAKCLLNLALLRSMLGRYQEAEEQARRALSIGEEKLGKGHPGVALAQQILGGIVCDQGRYGEAEKHLYQAAVSMEAALGGEHPKVGLILWKYGKLAFLQGHDDMAEQHLERARGILEAGLGSDHIEVAVAVIDLARVYVRQDKSERAMDCYRSCIGKLELISRDKGRLSPAQSIALASAYVGLGDLYRRLGELEEARDSWLSAEDLLSGFDGDTNLVDYLATRATALLNLDRGDAAAPLIGRLIETGWVNEDFFQLCRKHGGIVARPA